jgi:hypothetical protein
LTKIIYTTIKDDGLRKPFAVHQHSGSRFDLIAVKTCFNLQGSEYKIDEEIGEGTFSIVEKATNSKDPPM